MKNINQQKSNDTKIFNMMNDQIKPPKMKGSEKKKSNRKQKSAIPKAVANRMARRIAFTSGIPTTLGMSVFILSYLLITKGIAEIPPSLTLTSSALLFFMGLLGLSYGILSASWEENPGSILGIENIRPNIKKMRSAFQPIEKSKETKIN